MKKTLTIAALTSLTSLPALAQPLTGLFQWQVSADAGSTWSSSIAVHPGDPYRIRALASWTDGAIASVGFAGATFEQIDLAGADGSDTFGGATLGQSPTYLRRLQFLEPQIWAVQPGAGASASGLRIDRALDPDVARISVAQVYKVLPNIGPNPDFDVSNPIVVLDLDAVAGSPKTMTVSATWARTGTPVSNEFRIYTTETGVNKKPVQEATMIDAVVHIIPAPPASMTFAPIAAGWARRRRTHKV